MLGWQPAHKQGDSSSPDGEPSEMPGVGPAGGEGASCSSSPSPQAVVPSLGLCSHPHGPASIPDLHSWTHVSGWGTRGCGMNRLCRCHSVLPVPKARPLSPLISLLVRGLPQMQEPLLTFSSSPGVHVPSNFLSSFSFLYTLVLPSSVGIFLVLLGVRGPLLVFNGCPVELFHL